MRNDQTNKRLNGQTTKRLQMLFMAVMLSLATWAQDNNRLQLGEAAAKVGTTFDLPVNLENTNPNIVAAQFELTVPQGEVGRASCRERV